MLFIIHFLYGLLALFLFSSLIAESIKFSPLFLSFSLILLSLAFFMTVYKEWLHAKKQPNVLPLRFQTFEYRTLLFLIIGTFVTFYLNHTIGLGSVLASSIVGLIGAFFFKRYSTSLFCGSFIGMACSIIFSNPISLLVAALTSGIMLALSHKYFVGFGGKLGFIAFGGCYVASMLFQTPFRVIPALSKESYVLIFLYSMGTGLLTFALQKEWKWDAVKASALVGLILALVHPDATHTVVLAAYCASFTGMTSPKKVHSYGEMLGLMGLTSILFIAASPLFDGSGGKLGSIAFLSTLSGTCLIRFVKQGVQYVMTQKSKKHPSSQN